ncbi:Serine hydrolase [Planctomycetales bacterium 10988]|nr:Serine hydrolase [Planctomycetales bacterium 10988]
MRHLKSFTQGITFLSCLLLVSSLSSAQRVEPADSWTEQQVLNLPATETAFRLFNGEDLTGWKGQTKKYFSVKDGIIVAKNSEENAPAASTYLLTTKDYRNFRLIFEAKLVESEMHSGISLWGEPIEMEGDPFSYRGHLVMFPSNYGLFDLYRRRGIYRDLAPLGKEYGKQHGWNRMEILAIGNRIRHVVNGVIVADFTDPQPELCQPGPIGLQLHSNKVAQEIHFRGLILTENPEDQLITAKAEQPELELQAKRPANKLYPRANPNQLGMNGQVLNKIVPAMEGFIKEDQIAGSVTLVAKDGKIVHYKAVGKADLDSDKPMHPRSLFSIASMTKPITAIALMTLVEQGKVSIDDPLTKYIPAFKKTKLNSGPPKQPILIRHILTHTSGVVGSQELEGTLEETAQALSERMMGFEPGSKWQYGPSLTLAGRVVEVVSGKPFDVYLKETIFQPLKMVDTTFKPTPAQQNRIATIYQPNPDGPGLIPGGSWINELSANRQPNPSAGLYSTALDLYRLYQMLLNEGELDGVRILKPKTVREIRTIHTGDLEAGFTEGCGWGWGCAVVREPQGFTERLSQGTFGHGGAFGTQGWIDPERNMIFILMIQRTKFGSSDQSDLRVSLQIIATDALNKKN